MDLVDETHRYLPGGDIAESVPMCAHCGGMVAIRSPRGDCDHLCWPDMLTDEAKIANGFHKVDRVVTEWILHAQSQPLVVQDGMAFNVVRTGSA